ncbi:aluminum-activated malate transporter 8-like [Actinidia eriantha]|uniref:aluminum-activated malate transporter 8-like n=1 Tax=Actinidia eriantha TaxID=165200 RepID=UPI00258B955F|nr:aluminum-activated malate transporter 8-like [Actinidia eriantha]
MENESKTQEKTGFITRGWDRFKALPGNIKSKAVEIAKKTKKIGKDDPRRITHSLKVALALTLVSLFYYFKPLYDGFGSSSMWAVLTVVVVFEFTVGATLYKCMNRGFATFLAGTLGVGANYLTSLLGEEGEPIALGFLVFILTATCTFSRFFPTIKARYEYGFLIFILTFSLVSVSGYRVDKIIELAHQRLSTIMLGAAICMIISIFVCPVWAGKDLHNLVANNIEKLASFLEGFGGEYFRVLEDGDSDMVTKKDKSFLQGYKTVLNTKTTEESWANFAWWEPGHGNFGFHHPWKQYLQIGVVTRKCAFHFEVLSCYIHSDIQAPPEFLRKIQEPCKKMSSESGKALKELSLAIKAMTHPFSADAHLDNSKTAITDLKTSLEAASGETSTDLIKIIPAVTVASILTDITKCVEEIAEVVRELSQEAHFKRVEKIVSKEKPPLIDRRSVNPVGGGGGEHMVMEVHGVLLESSENENPHAPKKG